MPRPNKAALDRRALGEYEEVDEEVEDRWRAPRTPQGFNRYTKSQTGCPCWFNLTMTSECACCEDNAIQCGYPKHNECIKDKKSGQETNRKGCSGVDPKSKFTLSTTGYPCPWDPNDRTCAWCSLGSRLCIDESWAKPNNKGACVASWDNGCIAIAQDCRIEPSSCDPNAECMYTGKQQNMRGGFKWNVFRCVCKSGFTGNGIQCANDTTGLISPRRDIKVDLTMKLTTDIFEGPGPEADFPHGPTGNDLMKEIDDMLKYGPGVCGSGCNTTVVHCGKENEENREAGTYYFN